MYFKKCDELVDRVEKFLDSYSAAGMLDRGDFYRWIKEILTKLNVPAYSPVHRVENIEDGKLAIPDDVYQIWALYKYKSIPKTKKLNEIYPPEAETETISKYECYNECHDPCTVRHIEHKYNTMIIKHYLDNSWWESSYQEGSLLQLKPYKLEICDKDSVSLKVKSGLQVTTDNNYFYFNFDEGAIYLQYYKLMLDEDGLPMIPDVTQIEQAIEYYIMYKSLQKIYINGEENVVQRMDFLKNEYDMHFRIASSWVRLPTAKSLIEYGKLLRNKYNIFERVC